MDFPTTVEGWISHSQNVLLCQRSRVFVMHEYSYHGSVGACNKKHSTTDKYTNISSKGNVQEKSTPCERTSEMVIYTELLSLSDSFIEKTNRKFDNHTFWSLLSSLITKLADPRPNSDRAK